jgi:hypothetical protein
MDGIGKILMCLCGIENFMLPLQPDYNGKEYEQDNSYNVGEGTQKVPCI